MILWISLFHLSGSLSIGLLQSLGLPVISLQKKFCPLSPLLWAMWPIHCHFKVVTTHSYQDVTNLCYYFYLITSDFFLSFLAKPSIDLSIVLCAVLSFCLVNWLVSRFHGHKSPWYWEDTLVKDFSLCVLSYLIWRWRISPIDDTMIHSQVWYYDRFQVLCLLSCLSGGPGIYHQLLADCF